MDDKVDTEILGSGAIQDSCFEKERLLESKLSIFSLLFFSHCKDFSFMSEMFFSKLVMLFTNVLFSFLSSLAFFLTLLTYSKFLLLKVSKSNISFSLYLTIFLRF